MSNEVIIMVKGNREVKVLPIDVEAMEDQGYVVWEEPKEEPNLDKITVTELKTMLDEAGIEYAENAKKAELIALVEGAE